MLQGNIDPVTLLRDGTPASIVAAGCEVVRDTPPEHVLALAEFARQAGAPARRN